MPIVFALIIFIQGGGPSQNVMALKIGEYEKFSQCQRQGEIFAIDKPTWTLVSYKCVPVNATAK